MKSITWPILTVILAAVVVWGSFDRAHRRDELAVWIQTAVQRDTLHQLADGRYQRAAVALDKERELRAVLRDSLPVLHQELRRIRARESSYIHTIAQLQDVVAAGSAIDTVIITAAGDSVHQVSFEYSQPGIRIDGWTRTPPPRYQLHVQHDPIPLHIVVSELRDGSFLTNVETAPWVEISALDTRFVRRPKTWWQRNRIWIFPLSAVVLWEVIR